LPAYPDKVYDFYRINRFLSPGFSFHDSALWSEGISLMLRDLGPSKQVNAIIVVAKTNDRDYVAALRKHWEGANKNDVVLVIGSMDGHKIEFADVITWSKHELFKLELVQRVTALGVIDRRQLLDVVESQIAKNFVRRQMKDFEYLQNEIHPPMWLMMVLVGVLGMGYTLAAFLIRANPRRFGLRQYR
jgi:hypothetical protein